jgi:hypothetical protein
MLIILKVGLEGTRKELLRSSDSFTASTYSTVYKPEEGMETTKNSLSYSQLTRVGVVIRVLGYKRHLINAEEGVREDSSSRVIFICSWESNGRGGVKINFSSDKEPPA